MITNEKDIINIQLPYGSFVTQSNDEMNLDGGWIYNQAKNLDEISKPTS